MKKLIVATLILTGAATVSFAQSKNVTSNQVSTSPMQIGIEAKAKAETDKLAKSLDLNTDQKLKIQQVNVHYETQMDHIAKAGAAASPARSTYIVKYKEEQYQTILTADQYTKYQQLTGAAKSTGTLKAGN